MKKNYALIFGLTLSCFSFSQTIKQQIKPVPAKKIASSYTKSHTSGALIQDKTGEFWTNTFDTPSEWTLDNNGLTDPGFGWDIGATADGWFFGGTTPDPIQSTSGGNFAELNNGDPFASTQALDVVYTMTSSPIDVGTLAGTNLVKLSFLQYGARFNDAQEVYISEDGINFVKVGDNSNMPVLSASGGSVYDNPTLKEINLGDFLSANPTNVWIRFSWTTAYPNSATNPNVWVTYGWMIDDVSLATYPAYDLGINRLYWGPTGPWGTIPVYKVPQTQIAPIDFAAAIENKGSTDQTDVTFDVTDGAAYNGTSGVVALTVLQKDTVDVLTPYTLPATNGNYTLDFSLNSSAVDANLADNTLPSKTVEVNDFIYAVDLDTPDNSVSNQGDAYEVGNVFNIFTDQTLRSALVNINDGSTVGAQIFAKLYMIDETSSTFAGAFIEQYTNLSSYTITANDLGNWVQIPFEVPQDLIGGKAYALMIGSYGDGGATDDFICNASGTTSANGDNVFYDINLDTWYYTTQVSMIRMDFSTPLPYITSSEPDLAGCVGQSMTLTSSYSSGNQWFLNGNPISGETGTTLTVSAAGSYTVSSGGFTSNPANVVFNAVPSVTYNQVFDDVCPNYADVVLTPGTPAGGTFSGSNVSGNAFDPSIGAGTYDITYSVTQNGCTGSQASAITVQACLGLNENEVVDVNIYPNPTTGTFTVTNTKNVNTIELVDQLGRTLASWKVNQVVMNLDVTKIAQGNYTLVFKGDNASTVKQVQIAK